MAEVKEPKAPEQSPEAARGGSHQEGDRPQFSVVDRRFWATREGEDDGQQVETAPPPSRMPTYIEQLQAQLAEKDRLLRGQVAEMRSEQDQLRRRLARELEQRVEIALAGLLSDFLPVLDNLERALQSAEQHATLESLREGVHLVCTQFLGVLERHGLKPLERQGQLFDPSLDEAMTTVEVEDPRQHNLVLQEWAKGYTLHDKVLRPAKVGVGKKLAED